MRYQILIDIDGYDKMPEPLLDQRFHIERYTIELVKKLDMSILDGPNMAYGSEGKKGQESGWSCTTIIDFSSICFHAFDKSRTINLDVFSCKTFDPKLVIGLTQEYFGGSIKIRWISEALKDALEMN